MNCRSCQAPSDGTTLTCAYCGAALGNISGAADEMRAVDEILQLLQRTAESNKTTLDGDSKVATLIPVIWIPHTPEPKLRLAVALSGFGSDASGDAYGRKIADVALTKADAIARQLQIELAGDARVGALDAVIQKRRRLHSRSLILGIAMSSGFLKATVGITSIIVLLTYLIHAREKAKQAELDRRQREMAMLRAAELQSRAASHAEDLGRACRDSTSGDHMSACQELCESGRRWACETVARLQADARNRAEQDQRRVEQLRREVEQLQREADGGDLGL